MTLLLAFEGRHAYTMCYSHGEKTTSFIFLLATLCQTNFFPAAMLGLSFRGRIYWLLLVPLVLSSKQIAVAAAKTVLYDAAAVVVVHVKQKTQQFC